MNAVTRPLQSTALRPFLAAGLLLLVTGWTAAPLDAQRATERYIPVGQSPGLSGVETVIGEIESWDANSGTIVVRANGRVVRARVTDATDVWLDRSNLSQSALTGGGEDIRAGRTAELKFLDPEAQGDLDWVKIVVPAEADP